MLANDATAAGVTGVRSRGPAADIRSRTRPRNTGSLVYWAMPSPRLNGR